jgi:hypothetical protein
MEFKYSAANTGSLRKLSIVASSWLRDVRAFAFLVIFASAGNRANIQGPPSRPLLGFVLSRRKATAQPSSPLERNTRGLALLKIHIGGGVFLQPEGNAISLKTARSVARGFFLIGFFFPARPC